VDSQQRSDSFHHILTHRLTRKFFFAPVVSKFVHVTPLWFSWNIHIPPPIFLIEIHLALCIDLYYFSMLGGGGVSVLACPTGNTETSGKKTEYFIWIFMKMCSFSWHHISSETSASGPPPLPSLGTTALHKDPVSKSCLHCAYWFRSWTHSTMSLRISVYSYHKFGFFKQWVTFHFLNKCLHFLDFYCPWQHMIAATCSLFDLLLSMVVV
jgi:hypothetical protein